MPNSAVATDYPGYLFSLAIGAGGLMGYLKKGSVMSLIMGLLFAGILGLGSYFVTQNPQNVLLSSVATGLLSAVMGNRFVKSKKIMPSGLVFMLSLLMFIRYTIGVFS